MWSEGESFGLSIAEYLHQNKPVITNIIARDRNHVEMLGMNGYYYENPDELYYMFKTINKNYKHKSVIHLVEEFSPRNVMNKFDKIFLNGWYIRVGK